MPFDKISEIPPGSQWHRVDGDPEVTEGIEIYELKWAAATYGSSVFKKWKYFIYPKTNLPKRIEVFRKSAADGEYNLISMIEVQYLVDSDEIHAVIKNAGF
jgi:hypoxanthine phosphoribosyltransferase